MKTKKTRQELEDRLRKNDRNWAIFCILFLIVGIITGVLIGENTQLSECQENKTIIYKSCITNMLYQPCNQTSGHGYYDCSKFKEIENCEVISEMPKCNYPLDCPESINNSQDRDCVYPINCEVLHDN